MTMGRDFSGASIVVTSPIAVGILNSKLGNTEITAAVVNDIMSLIMLSIIVQLAADGGISQLNVGDIIVTGINITVFLEAYFYRHHTPKQCGPTSKKS